MVSRIRRVVLDVLKPHKPTIIELSKQVSVTKGVSGVNCSLDEVDQDTETVKITIEGDNIDFEAVINAIESVGGVVHSIDSVSTGKRMVDQVETMQDK
jgi:hypothetical protein